MRPARCTFRAAVALLLLLPFRLACQYEEAAREVSQPNYTHYLNELLFARAGDSRGSRSVQHDAARTNIRDALASFGLTVTLEPFQYRGGVFYNVTAVLPGKTRAGEYHVIGAHYDSVNNPGADDDASGVAALLETARVASMHDFDASIAFVAFDLEEPGMIGSQAWTVAHAGDRILSMLTMDMIGYNPPGPSHNMIALCHPNTLPNAALAVIQGAVAQYSGALTPIYGGVSTRSDHASFAGLAPAVEMIEASFYGNVLYHTAADSVDLANYIDYQFASAATRSAVGYLARQAGLVAGDSLAFRLRSGGVYNAASFIAGTTAPAELVTLVGYGLDQTRSVAVRDSEGTERPAGVIYRSPRQINLILPAVLAPGAATLTLTRDDGLQATAGVDVGTIAPGVFTAESSGMGAPAAQAVRVAPDGAQTVQNLFECRAISGCAPAAVDFGSEDDRVFLVLFGTGIRGRRDAGSVSLEIDGEQLPAQYAGVQPDYPGLDQVNVELPHALRGKGRVMATLRLEGKAANPVAVNLGNR